MNRKDVLRYLLAMAAVDGRIRGEELVFLTERAITWGVTDDEFEALLDEISNGEPELKLPETMEEKVQILKNLIGLMAVDGALNMEEKQLFAQLATRMHVSAGEINHIIDTVLAEYDDTHQQDRV